MRRRTGIAATLVATVVLLGTLGAGAGPAAAASVDAERWTFCKINEERRARGLAPLAWDGAVAASARSWSTYMAATGALAHDPGFAQVLFSLVSGATSVAENVGRSSGEPQGVHQTFMGSDGHRANLLSATSNRVGVGVVRDGAGRLWVTHRFVGGPAPANPDTCPEGTAGAAASAPGATPFADVPGGAYYEDAVIWAVEAGVTTGATATTFAPNAPVTRAQVAAFVWRSLGQPSGTGALFGDVPADAYYAPATSWMRSAGLRAACAPDRFCPGQAAPRAAIVTWLWQAAGSPDHGTGHGFADVPAGAHYERAVTWAAQTGVTSGTSATTFSPADTVTRAQTVTFLWRAQQ